MKVDFRCGASRDRLCFVYVCHRNIQKVPNSYNLHPILGNNRSKMEANGKILFCSLVLFFSLIEQGDSLRCWGCASDMDAPCADYFNVTKIMMNQRYQVNQDVQLLECPPFSPENRYNYDQKVVCMKKKITTHGRSHYMRQCSYIRADDSVGTCPAESIGSVTMINFCEYCDTDGCNGSSALRTAFFLCAILPVITFLQFLN